MPPVFDDTIRRITELIFTESSMRPVDVAIILGAPNATAARPAVDLFRAGLVLDCRVWTGQRSRKRDDGMADHA